MEALTLWVTSDGIKPVFLRGLVRSEAVGISAELDGISDRPESFYLLDPNKSIRVHASTPQLKIGAYLFTAHAEFARFSNGFNNGIGTSDSEPVTATLSAISRNSR
jgi:hypothetical protein